MKTAIIIFVFLSAPYVRAQVSIINYYSESAEHLASQVNARDLSFKNMDHYDFYHNFINYQGYKYLPKSILGSATFMRRLKYFMTLEHAPWSPFDAYNFNGALQAARSARKSLCRKALLALRK